MVQRLRGGGPPHQTIAFLIDGASSATIVNDITLLDPSSVVQVTESHNSAAKGAQVETTAVGLMTRMWQLRDGSWVAFSVKASFAESLDINVLAECSLDAELSLIADKFEKQELCPKGITSSDPSCEIPLARVHNMFYVHTAALPVVCEEDRTPSRVNYAIDGQKIGLLGSPSLGSAMPLTATSLLKQSSTTALHKRPTPSDGALALQTKLDLPKHVYRNKAGATLPYYAQVWNSERNVHVGSYASPQEASTAGCEFKLEHELHESAKRAGHACNLQINPKRPSLHAWALA